MIKKINILFTSMFFVGYSRYAPGTVASFITCIIFIFFYILQIKILPLVLLVVLIFTLSVYSIDKLGKFFNEVDAKEIVIDEFVGQSIPNLTVYYFVSKNDLTSFILYTFISFLFFRFFDITKPYPANIIDKKMKNGFGVMLDDIVAGVYTSVVVLIITMAISYE